MILPNFDFLYLWIITSIIRRFFTFNNITDFHIYCNIISKILHISVTFRIKPATSRIIFHRCGKKKELRGAPFDKFIL